MVPSDDDSKQAVPGCEVDLKTRTIRFLGCADEKAMTSAADKRVAALSGRISAPHGFTNRQRREMNRERNFLQWCRSTDWQDYKPESRVSQAYRERCAQGRTCEITLQPDGKWSHRVVL